MKDLAGKRFGKLVGIKSTGRRNGANNLVWLLKCDCGNLREADNYDVRRGKITSCHSCGRERCRNASVVHGQSFSPTHRVWSSMLTRCFNPKCKSYPRYGGRGITVCERWLSFTNFYADMGKKPDGRSLDRIDVNGNYELSNCRWATPIEQANNTSTNRWVSIGGEVHTVAEWARLANVTPMTIKYRLNRGETDILRPATKDSKPKLYEHSGQTLKLSQWSRKVGIRKGLLELRLSRGWSFERAIGTPLQRKRG